MFGVFGTVFCFLIPFTCSERLHKDIKFANCGPAGSVVTSVGLSPCSQEPCSFKHGINATVTINFTSDMDVNNVTSLVYGEILGQDIPYPLPKPHACIDCNLNCPLQKGQSYSYINTLPIKKEYPDIKLPVKFTLVNEQKTALACVVFLMQIEG